MESLFAGVAVADFPRAAEWYGRLFGRDMLDPERREHQRRLLGELVVAHLTAR